MNTTKDTYQSVKIKTASRGQIVVMLYAEAIKQIETAEGYLKEKKKQFDKINNSISKARDIITELTSSLDMQNGGKFAESMFSLYMWFNEKLSEGNIKKDPAPLREVIDNLLELKEAWEVAIENTKGMSFEDNTGKKGLDISS